MSRGFNPPFPSHVDDGAAEDSSGSQKNHAQQFLNLVRLVDKGESGSAYDSRFEELVDLMNSLIDLYSRRGLLLGNVAKAQRILSSSSSSQQGKRSGPQDKKTHGKKPPSTELQIHAGENGTGGSESSTQPLSENLIFTALTRIFSDSKDSVARSSSLDSGDSLLLVALAAELCLAISQFIQTHRGSGDPCSTAEYEMMAQSGKPILNGLVAKIKAIEEDVRLHSKAMGGLAPQRMAKCLSMAQCLDEDRHINPILSCLRASCSLVNLFGTKLSRSTALLVDLKVVAWRFLTIPDERVQEVAARLLSSIPLAGGTDRKVPVELWNVGISDVVVMMNQLIDAVAPVNKSEIHGATLSEESESVFQGWISFLRQDITGDSARVSTFQILLRGLVLAFRHFLSRDSYGSPPGILLEARLGLDTILEVLERFLSYPMSAESLYFRTKKRLRDEAVDGGLISPRAIALKVANEVKRLGHEMLDCLVSSIGGPALLPFAKRIIRMSYASLLTSCSGPVRKVMDPASGVQLEGKKRRWLHLSVPLRTKSVTTVHLVAVAFGSDRTSKLKSSERSEDSKSDGELALTLVAGCLMEQIGPASSSEGADETWGTMEERVELIIASLDCLRAALASSNGFMGFVTRSIVDSIALTCLDKAIDSAGFFIGWSSVQCSVFQLATTCVSTPWTDGSTTCIVPVLKKAAARALLEQDEVVSSKAQEALRVCDLFGVPRAPPLIFASRYVTEDPGQVETSAPKLIEKIQMAQMEANKARAAMEEAEKAKANEKRQREAEKEASNKRQREAKTMKVPPKEAKPAATVLDNSEAPGEAHVDDVKPTSSAVTGKDVADEPIESHVDSGEDGIDEAMKETDVELANKESEPTEPGRDDAVDDDEEMGDFPDIVAGGPDSDDD